MSDSDGLRRLRDRGPFDTERVASMASRAHERMKVEHRPGTLSEENANVFREAIGTAAIEIGDHDQNVLAWLAGWEPSTVNAIAGMLTRAYLSGRQEGELWPQS